MAKFLFWSDLHLEFAEFDIPRPVDGAHEDVDAILIAGDTDVKARHIDFAKSVWDIWQRPILMIDGNHEPYGAKRIQKLWEIEDERLDAARQDGADIEIMRGTQRIIGDTRVIGATLWTDMRLYPDRVAGAQIQVGKEMNDYKKISFHEKGRGIYRKLAPRDTQAMHASDKAKIFGHLAEPFEGSTVVMSHHLPVRQMISPKRVEQMDLVTAAYASDLAHEICRYPIDAWICGHSHDCVEAMIDGPEKPIKFLRNIRGYPGQETDFDPLRVLDSVAPRLRAEIDEENTPCPDV